MKRISIRLKLLFFISILFVAAIGNAVISFQLEKHGEEKLQWVNHTHEVIIETKKLLNNIQRAETGQRGYLITKNSSYLEPYHAGSGEIKYHFELLQRLISDNPAQTALLESIEKITQLKLDELSKTVKLTYENRYTEALEVVNKNKGKKYMDEINDLLTDFINTERLLLEKRKGDYREHRAQLTNIIYVEIVFVIFLSPEFV